MISLSVHLPVPPRAVWDALADLGAYPEWMRDAVAIRFLDERRAGLGTRMEVATRVGPIRITDPLTVVEWVDGEVIGVEHTGWVTGRGRFEVLHDGAGTILVWSEDLRFPWWLGGPVTAGLARPVLIRLWRKDLNKLVELLVSDR